jgi:hypothetical protein
VPVLLAMIPHSIRDVVVELDRELIAHLIRRLIG